MDETMSPARSITMAGLMALLGAIPMIFATPVAAQIQAPQSNPMVVTTDTPEYCLHLLDRVSDLVRTAVSPVPREVTDLTTEGHRMCEHGETKGGIRRLRSALMMMRQDDGTAQR
jgi:hypothetical protein